MCLHYKSFEIIAAKGEIAHIEQFLLFPQRFPTAFSTCLENFLPFSTNFKLSSANSFGFEENKICRLGKGKPITRRQTLDSSKLKDFAHDNFEFDENGSKLSKRVENTVGKGEIARHERFLLFPQCFQKACFPGVSKGVIVWEWVK